MLHTLLLFLAMQGVPNIAIMDPLPDEEVAGRVEIYFAAHDPDGLALFEFLVDGIIRDTIDVRDIGAGGLPFRWNTANESVGEHDLTAKLYDTKGDVTTSKVIKVKVVREGKKTNGSKTI